MTMLFEWLVSNAITASLLAVVALAVGYAFPRRPALAHACWLLVLLKFLTPPIYVFSFSVQNEAATKLPPVVKVEPQQTLPIPANNEVIYTEPVPVFDIDQFASALSPLNQLLVFIPSDTAASLPGPMPIAPPEQSATASSPVVPPVTWSAWLLSLWNTWAGTLIFSIQCIALLGTTYLLVVTLIRMIHFENLLQLARPAPAAVNQLMHNLAKPLQLKHLPQIVVSSGKVGPLLWQRWNTPIIVLPAGLVETLSAEELSTVLAHELTHYRRGDPFWRYLELVAVASYWWLPTAWLASARLRQAEEECCDAAVVAALPDGVASYAQALVRSLHFVTEPSSPCPALSSGLGPVTLLKRRLSMLPMNVERRLGLRGWLFMMAVAALALPFGVSLAQADDDDTPPPPPPARNAGATLPTLAPSAAAAPRGGAAGIATPAVPSRPATPPAFPTAPAYQPYPGGAAYTAPNSFNPFQGGEDARSSAEFAVREAELELKMKRAKLKQAERTLTVNQKEVARNKTLARDGSISSTEVDLANAKLGQAEGDVEMARLEIERAELNVEQAKRRMSGVRGGPATPAVPPAVRGSGVTNIIDTDERARTIFQSIDRKKEGKVAKEDFPEFMKGRFEEFDTNRDGFVNLDEFKAHSSIRGGGRGVGFSTTPPPPGSTTGGSIGFGAPGSPPPTPSTGGGGVAGFGTLPPGASGGGAGFSGGSFPPGGPGGFGGRASADPFFRNFDRRGTGKIERNDVPEWMRERFFETLDSNKDGTVDQTEFNEGYSKFWGANPGPAGMRGGMTASGGGGGGIGRGGMAGGLGGGGGGGGRGGAAGGPPARTGGRADRDPRDERIEQLEKELNELRIMLDGLKKKDPIR
jgi:beta-lactamase regulating signal transducer with metallopeptidase domain/Ca2+-binding EF-hand superfamily protein